MTIDKKVKLFRVILADDNKDMLDTIAAVLEPAAEFDIVTTVADGKALVDAVFELKPDIGIIDISMPIMTGIEAVGEIRKVDPDMKIVFLTVNEDRDFVEAAFEAGGNSFVIKRRMASDLLLGLRAALAGHRFVSADNGNSGT